MAITNKQSETNIQEVADEIYRINTPVIFEGMSGGFSFNQYLMSLLPGSQCGQCGFPGCRPAAEALAEGNAPATICPPGGSALAEQIAALLGLDLDLSDVKEPELLVARVSEATCTGCTRCFKVCPTDAIVGAPKQIHALVADACIGCKKCVDVCPTECLQMHPIEVTLRNWRWTKPTLPETSNAVC